MNKYIKIFNEQIAKMIESGGFSYMTEKINDNQTIYVFDECDEIFEILENLTTQSEYQEIIYITDDSLSFGG